MARAARRLGSAGMGRGSVQEASPAMVGARCNIVARVRPTVAGSKTLTG
jgi:hypothetical protein